VLAGVIGAVLAGVLAEAAPHSLPQLASVAAAVIVHGLAGELAAAEADLGMIASDIVSQLPAAFSSVRRAAAGA
jgi:NAD(P)H-hydrate repair Nnr-like enzyme with NAD(P)H-hydrate dehydratase domain